MTAVTRSAARSGLAAAAMAGAAWGVTRLGSWERGGNDLGNVLWLGGACLVGGVVYLVATKLLRSPELEDVLAGVRRRVKR